MSTTDRWKKILAPYLEGEANAKGETRIRCLSHDDSRASATVNFEKGVWRCHGCGAGGRIADLVQQALQRNLDDDDGRAAYDPFGGSASATEVDVVSLSARRKAKAQEAEGKEPLTEAKVLGYAEELQQRPKMLKKLMDKRGLTEHIIKEYEIGYDEAAKRFVIPIRDEDGNLINLRRYKTLESQRSKFTNADGWGSPPSLFPLPQLVKARRVILTEGELDALICIDYGFDAASGTGGALRWGADWARYFKGKKVYVAYDNDDEGRRGARKAAHAISAVAESVVVLPPMLPDVPKSDLTDWFMQGGTPEELEVAMETADVKAANDPGPLRQVYTEAEPTDIHVIGSMDSRTNGKPLRMNVTVTGRRDPTYSVPRDLHMECTLDYGESCQRCPMMTLHDGDHRMNIDVRDTETIAQFIDSKKEKVGQIVKSAAGVPPRCNKLRFSVAEAYTVEELFVTGSMDKRSTDSHDYTQRRVFNVTDRGGDTRTNMEAVVSGTTTPSPKDRHNEFFSWDLTESTTSIDTFEVAPEIIERLKAFRPAKGQKPLEKMREISSDLSTNVTGIYGRERMHMAMDIAWHSVLQFEFLGKLYDRGWVELLIIGGTRTGKSDTVQRLTDHYGLGHIIGCEGATFAGLIGGVKQVGDRWTVQWGEVTLNDRRLVVLDEASGLSQEIISQMSDVRSRGTAQLTKVESQQTKARCRMIWISNPRKSKHESSGSEEKTQLGIDMIEGLIGTPEDIARFDLAMSVAKEDVPDDAALSDRKIDPSRSTYSNDMCHDLILWAWSRKPYHVVISDETVQAVRKWSKVLGTTYVSDPPLIQMANVKDKLVRISTAIAARLFSSDASGEKVIVKSEHVEAAATFLDQLYGYDNFGYRRISERINHNRRIAEQSVGEVREFLKGHPKVLRFLINRRGSFRAQDIEEMSFMGRDEVQEVLSYLTERHMVDKDKSQIVKTPKLSEILIEIEDEMMGKERNSK